MSAVNGNRDKFAKVHQPPPRVLGTPRTIRMFGTEAAPVYRERSGRSRPGAGKVIGTARLPAGKSLDPSDQRQGMRPLPTGGGCSPAEAHPARRYVRERVRLAMSSTTE